MSYRAQVERFDLPLSAPLTTADGTIDRRRGFLLRLHADGVTGLGEATPLPGWTEPRERCAAALDEAAAALDGGDADAALGATAAAPAARHAVSLALADVEARRADQSLARHLATDAAASVPVNATVGDADPEPTAAAAADAVRAGYPCVKVKVGARDPAADAARLRAVREAVAPDVTLRADANGAWDRETAREALDAFESLELAYVEQPLPATDLAGHAALRDGPVAVALDESVAATSVGAILDAHAADVLVLKPMALGGPDRTRDAAERALGAGVTPVVTTTVDAVVARTAAVHVAATLPDPPPCGLATADRLATDLAPDPAPVVDGAVAVPDGPGLGVAPGEVSVP
jgi:o-succinylbenzoate synthase